MTTLSALASLIVSSQAMRRITSFVMVAITFSPTLLNGAEPDHDALFLIERNKNANIVQYDARFDANGMLLEKEPVAVYWVRLAEQGQVKKLTWSQRKFAYGFKVKLDKNDNVATMDMALNIDRAIVVKQEDGDYRAVIQINGVASFLEKIFIQASGKGISTRVDYIELYGNAVNNLDEQYERITRAR